MDIIFADYSKAFDSIPHIRLIIKIKSYGIKDKLLKWIGSFLSNREQSV